MDRPPPDDAKYFGFSPLTLWSIRIAVPGSFAMAAFVFVRVWSEPRPLSTTSIIAGGLGVALFAALGVLGWRSMRRLKDRFAVNEEGIWSLPNRGEPRFIAWQDVSRVKADDIMTRLLIWDSSDEPPLRLENQLNDAAALRAFVENHVPAKTQAILTSRPVFHRSWIMKIFLSAVTPLGWWMVWLVYVDRGSFVLLLLFCGMAIAPVVAILRDPITLEIGQGVLIIAYPGWKRVISFRDIVSVEAADRYGKGNISVQIKLKQDLPIKLYSIREGSLALADTLQIALGGVDGSATAIP